MRAQLFFNVSTVTTAAGLAYVVFHDFDGRHGAIGSPALVLAAATYFLINTLPVATIISLTEGVKVVRTWSGSASLLSLLRGWYWNHFHSARQEWLHGLGIVDEFSAGNDRNLSQLLQVFWRNGNRATGLN